MGSANTTFVKYSHDANGNTIDYTYDRFSNRATMTVADMDEYTVEYDYDLNLSA